jgi:predicted RNA binding protein YcfA (HicA-like mRNA interferase family)
MSDHRKKLTRALEALGFRLHRVTSKCHYVYRHPERTQQLLVSDKEGDPRAFNNTLRDARRIIHQGSPSAAS